jgi:hypothetical protein
MQMGYRNGSHLSGAIPNNNANSTPGSAASLLNALVGQPAINRPLPLALHHVPDTSAVPASKPHLPARAGAVKIERPTGRTILTAPSTGTQSRVQERPLQLTQHKINIPILQVG